MSSLLTAPDHERIWGALTASLRAQLTAPAEQSLFPGLVIVCLALLGLSWRSHRRSIRVGVAGAAVAVTVLALGFHGPADGIAYQLLDELPGWSGIRTPGRLITFTTLALAILAAIGAQRLLTAVQARSTSRRPLLLATLLLVGAIAAEGTGSLPLSDALPPPARLASAPGPILVLPSNDFVDPEYMPWSTTSFQPLVNGTAGFIPNEQQRFRAAARTFPAAASISSLERHGIRTVVLDRYYPPATPPLSSRATTPTTSYPTPKPSSPHANHSPPTSLATSTAATPSTPSQQTRTTLTPCPQPTAAHAKPMSSARSARLAKPFARLPFSRACPSRQSVNSRGAPD